MRTCPPRSHQLVLIDPDRLTADESGAALSAGAEIGLCRFGVVRRAFYPPPAGGAGAGGEAAGDGTPRAVAVKVRLGWRGSSEFPVSRSLSGCGVLRCVRCGLCRGTAPRSSNSWLMNSSVRPPHQRQPTPTNANASQRQPTPTPTNANQRQPTPTNAISSAIPNAISNG